jgi:cytochrome P450 family 6
MVILAIVNFISDLLIFTITIEVLRLHPPITFLPKECTEALDIESINHKHVHIQQGLSIYIPVMNYHYDKEYFEEPSEFMPER